MVQKHNNRKGATLAEMMVVLAVVAIVSTMVISFSMLVSQRTTISAAKLDVMDDVTVIESIIEGWILRMDQPGASISANADGLTATVTADDAINTYTLTFTMLEDEGRLQGVLPNGEALTCFTKRVKSVDFVAVRRDDGNDALYFCTVTAEIPGLNKGAPMEQVQTFCINPHVGETVGGVAQ